MLSEFSIIEESEDVSSSPPRDYSDPPCER